MKDLTGLFLAAAAGFALWIFGRDAEASDDGLGEPGGATTSPGAQVGTFTPQSGGSPGVGGFASSMSYPWQTQPPPNVSGKAAGYNTERFPDSLAVRRALDFLGYSMALTNMPPPASDVVAFQNDYNEASEESFGGAQGYLDDDGVPGKFTLRALEIAAFGTDGVAGVSDLVKGPLWADRFGLL